MTVQIDIKTLLLAVLTTMAVYVSSTNAVHAEGFVHGSAVNVDGEDYYLLGRPDGPNGERDLPGHAWVQADPESLMGKHFNT